jgi:putative PIN family toxin of toxin-antitoxin system
MKVVLDSNVLVAGLRSNRGASHAILRALAADSFQVGISVPLIFEYESVLTRPGLVPGLTRNDLRDFVDWVCSVGIPTRIHYLWRPLLSDPRDDMVLETAVAAGARVIVTHNMRDFAEARRHAVIIQSPASFLRSLSA